MPTGTSISRGPEILRINGVRAASLTALLELFTDAYPSCLVSDLTFGPWRGHWIASEFRRQLGDEVCYGHDREGRRNFLRYASTIAEYIDCETLGRQSILRSFEKALRVVEQAGVCTFVVLAPRFGMHWGEENTWFLRFLAQGLVDMPGRLVIVSTGPDTTPLPEGIEVEWSGTPSGEVINATPELADLVPGVLSPGIIKELEIDMSTSTALRLPDGEWLVAPERRRNPFTTPRFLLTQLAYASKGIK